MDVKVIATQIRETLKPQIWSALVLTITLLTTGATMASDHGLGHVQYGTAKPTYYTAEPIIVTARFCNASDSVFKYKRDSLWQLSIVNQDDRILPFHGPSVTTTHFVSYDQNGNLIDPRRVVVPPDECGLKVWKNLCDRYGDGGGIFESFLPPGTYRMWNTYYPSDTLAFVVENPVEARDIEALNSLMFAFEHSAEIFPEQYYSFYHDFYERFSTTAYAERALRMLVICHPAIIPGVSDSAYQFHIREVILRYPTSALVLEAIPGLDPSLALGSQRDSLKRIVGRRLNDLPTDSQRDAARQVMSVLEK